MNEFMFCWENNMYGGAQLLLTVQKGVAHFGRVI
jgi:hypothetical protein